MEKTLRPSSAAKLVAGAEDWRLNISDEQFELTWNGQRVVGALQQLESMRVKSGIVWASLVLTNPRGETLELRGASKSAAHALRTLLDARAAARERKKRAAELAREFDAAVEPVVQWAKQAMDACERQFQRRGWLGREFVEVIKSARPKVDLKALRAQTIIQVHIAQQSRAVQSALDLWDRAFEDIARAKNVGFQQRVLTEDAQFFDQVEKSPLTAEQRQAVINFDNRVLLLAAAGSGKTSTMVAKAGYALRRNLFAPDRMLLLAFNNDAAAELRERLAERLSPLGLPATAVSARTFHAFGLEVIGAATGKKPSLAPWVESGKDLDTLLELIDALKDSEPLFRLRWDLLRVVFGQDLPKFGEEAENPDSWDRATKQNGFWTLNGETVKSRGELLIANWLFYNGVRYVYEGEYRHDTATAAHRQYRPDFYLPDADAYLEHWAVDASGNPPAKFAGYKESMVWKRELHAHYGTTLLETTMAGLWTGEAFEYLERELVQRGVALDPNPDRESRGRRPIESPRLARTFRTFLTHVKSNRLTVGELRKRLLLGQAGVFRFRHELFLQLFERIWRAWEDKLQADRAIDYDDMLILATDHLEAGRWKSPYELVMVDEFQDASEARARMVNALVSGKGRHLFAVGDDWQSINRFAGSDLSVMTDFAARFGAGTQLKLETTFRCPQSLCDLSSAFILKNPAQLRKAVRSTRDNVEEPVRIVRVAQESYQRMAIQAQLASFAQQAISEQLQLRVYILGRYRSDSEYLPTMYDRNALSVEFLTVHRSKGLEADHIIIPSVTSETLGFPSRIEDDPVLQLAMPGGDKFAYAEERRLFYVAITRAKRSVTLYTVEHKESAFVTELVSDQGLIVKNADGSDSSAELCPKCSVGFLQTRNGRYGAFLGCTTFPRCSFTRNFPK